METIKPWSLFLSYLLYKEYWFRLFKLYTYPYQLLLAHPRHPQFLHITNSPPPGQLWALDSHKSFCSCYLSWVYKTDNTIFQSLAFSTSLLDLRLHIFTVEGSHRVILFSTFCCRIVSRCSGFFDDVFVIFSNSFIFCAVRPSEHVLRLSSVMQIHLEQARCIRILLVFFFVFRVLILGIDYLL